MKRWTTAPFTVLLVLVLLVGCFLIVFPPLSTALIDFGGETEVEWRLTPGTKEAVVTIPDDMAEAMARIFNGPRVLPVNEWTVWFCALLVGMAFMLLMIFVNLKVPDNKAITVVCWTVFPVQIVLMLGCISAGIANSFYFSVPESLRATISDPELANAAVHEFRKWQAAMFVVPLMVFIVIDAVVVIFGAFVAIRIDKRRKHARTWR